MKLFLRHWLSKKTIQRLRKIKLIIFRFIIRESEQSTDEIFNMAINCYDNKEWKCASILFQKIDNRKQTEKINRPYKFYLYESLFYTELKAKNESTGEYPFFSDIVFNFKNFVGVKYFLKNAVSKSCRNKESWKYILNTFNNIISFVQTTDKSIVYCQNPNLLIQINELSKWIDNDIELELLPKEIWFTISNLFLLSRQYSKYYFIRESILKNMTYSRPDTVVFQRLKQYVNVVAEIGSRDLYLSICEHIKTMKSDNKDLISIYAAYMYFGETSFFKEQTKKYFTPDDIAFAKYIRNKTIAIVGPVDTGLDNGEEIDTFDVVVRFNYKGLEKYNSDHFGRKTTLSFYINRDIPKNIYDKQMDPYFNELDWILCHHTQDKTDKCFSGTTTKVKKRFQAWDTASNPFFKGSPNSVQRVVLDLLRFECKVIKVFNVNIFLDDNYAQAYRPNDEKSVIKYVFPRHDPISNFVFLRALYDNALIEADDVLSKILQMTKEEYIEAIDTRYGIKTE